MKSIFSVVVWCILGLIPLGVMANTGAELKISEVYGDGDMNWIEIVNIGTGDFSGSVLFGGTQGASQIFSLEERGSIDNFSIPAKGISLIHIRNNTGFDDYILDDSCVYRGKVLSGMLGNNADFSLNLLYTGENGSTGEDSFIGLSGRGYRISQQQDLSGNIYETTEDEIYNTFHSIQASPCYSPLLTGVDKQTTNWSGYVKNDGLKITEVYYKSYSYKEWIEITNTSDEKFEGTISFVGHKKYLIQQIDNIAIEPGEVVVFHNNNTLSYFSGVSSENIYSGLDMNLEDTERMSISLFSGGIDSISTGTLQDIFYVESPENTTTSYQKTYPSRETSQPTQCERYNITGDAITANPGIVYKTGRKLAYPSSMDDENVYSYCPSQVAFSEIKPSDTNNTSFYVEILAKATMSGTMKLSGTAIGGSILRDNTFSSGGYYLFHNGSSTSHSKGGLSQLAEGELELYFSGVLQDERTIENLDVLSGGQSYYRDEMVVIGTGTPGIAYALVNLLPIQNEFTEDDCERDFGDTCFNTGACPSCPDCPDCPDCNCGTCDCPDCPTCPTAAELCGTGGNTGTSGDETGSTSGGLFDDSVVKISRLLPNPDGTDRDREEIGLVLLSGDILDISDRHIEYDGDKYWSFSNANNSILQSGCENVFTGFASLVNPRDICVSLFSGDVKIDEGCYEGGQDEVVLLSGYDRCDQDIGSQTGNTQGTGTIAGSGDTTTGTQTSQRTGSLRIINIVYDPTIYDPDANRRDEQLTIHNVRSNHDADLHNRTVVTEKGRSSDLTGTLASGGQLTITDNFGFVNDEPLCVHLYYHDDIHDTFCYDPTQEEEEDDNVATGEIEAYREFDLRLREIVYDPEGSDYGNEQVSIEYIQGSGEIDMSQIDVVAEDDHTSLDGMMTIGQTKTFTDTFGFVNSRKVCVQLQYQDYVYDTLCYDPIQDEEENEDETQDGPDYTDRVIRLREIVYDPPGSDAGNEQVTIELMQGDEVDLQYLNLRVEDKNKTIEGILTRGTKTLKGSFGLVNSRKVCVQIVQGDYVFDEKCYDPLLTPDPSPLEERGDIYSGIDLKILDLVYDPEGNDKDKETITLRYEQGELTGVNLHDFHLMIGDRKKTLKYLGVLPVGEMKTFTGNFRFPNRKDTCVSLMREDVVFDTYCYTIQEEAEELKELEEAEELKAEELKESEEAEKLKKTGKIRIDITSVLPNPRGADGDQEFVGLTLTQSAQSFVVLDDAWTLSFGRRNISLSGKYLEKGQEVLLTGKLGLRNSSNCIDLMRYDQVHDTFCYQDAPEGVVLTLSNSRLQDIPDDIFAALQDVKLQKGDGKVCMNYYGRIIKCTSVPRGKVTVARPDAYERLEKNYRKAIEETLRRDYPLLRYHSVLNQYYYTYRASLDTLDKGDREVSIAGISVDATDINTHHRLRYGRTEAEVVGAKVMEAVFGELGR